MYGYELVPEFSGYGEAESPFTEAEEMAFAAELLGVGSEAELDQFLGNIFKKVGGFVGKIAKGPLGGVLKGIAKKALPWVGGALGSFIPIPGVGTAVGTALGTAASKLFEVNLEGMSYEDQEFEMARRFVRLAGASAQNAAAAPPDASPQAAARAALMAAAQKHAPGLLAPAGADLPAMGRNGRQSGHWIRRGRAIILYGA
ncbi:MAG: hypothetical protein ACREEM_29485 [Blastocatellia bacterium]